jgi:hypothetical protein
MGELFQSIKFEGLNKITADTFNISSIVLNLLDTFWPDLFQLYFVDAEVDVHVDVAGFSINFQTCFTPPGNHPMLGFLCY